LGISDVQKDTGVDLACWITQVLIDAKSKKIYDPGMVHLCLVFSITTSLTVHLSELFDLLVAKLPKVKENTRRAIIAVLQHLVSQYDNYVKKPQLNQLHYLFSGKQCL
jgi:hypothetical protein